MLAYQSCRWVEHGMVLDQGNVIRHCNNFNPKYGGRPIIYSNYCDDTINWDDFFKIKNKYREIFRNNECPEECINCTSFEQKKWDSENYIDYILFTPWIECNSRCIYCYNSGETDEIQRNTKKYSIVKLIKDMIEKNILVKSAILDFAGGEPTMYEDFEELLNLLIDNGYKTSVVHTNAIKHNKAIENGIKKGVVNILVSIDAGTKETHKKIKGVDSYDDVWNNLETYAKVQSTSSNNVKTKYIVMPGINDKKEEIDIWLNKSHKIGVKNVVLNLDHNWLLKNINSIPLSLYELIDYTQTQAKKLNMVCELYGEMFRLKCEVEKSVECNKAGFFNV